MNKEDILNKSRKENKDGDERAKEIEKTANANSFRAIIIVNTIFIVILFFQKLFIGEAFADIQVFFLAMFVSWVGDSATKYYYNKSKKDLYTTIVSVIGAIFTIANIVFNGMGWF